MHNLFTVTQNSEIHGILLDFYLRNVREQYGEKVLDLVFPAISDTCAFSSSDVTSPPALFAKNTFFQPSICILYGDKML